MKTYSIPHAVSYKGKEYEIDYSADNILSIFDLMEDETISDYDRPVALVTKMFGIYAPVDQVMVDKALEIIRLGKTEEEHKEQVKDFDFNFDKPSVRMDIIREYGVDIDKVKVDWDWLVYAIENLSPKSITNQKRMYRTLDTKKIKDKEQRKHYEKLKKSVALPSIEKGEEEKSSMELMFEEYKRSAKEDYKKMKGG